MFALSEQDQTGAILSCADGPASFNAELGCLGRFVVSVDPLYRFCAKEIQGRIDAVYPVVMEQLRQNLDDYVWTHISSPKALGELRLAAMAKFLTDFQLGREEGRYLPHSLPNLPLEAQSFDLALCSHFLFLYSSQFKLDFHRRAIEEMLRVASEVRIFPLVTLESRTSPHLKPICNWLEQSGINHEINTVNYEFQRGGNRMLRIYRNQQHGINEY